MDTLTPLQKLAVTVNQFKDNIVMTATRVSVTSNSNNDRASQYHSKFSELLSEYSVFANEYKSKLDNLHKALQNEINLQQKERERQQREYQSKLESLSNKSSNSNLEIAENVEETGYHSSTNSVHNIPLNSPQREDSELEQDTLSVPVPNTASINIPMSIPSPKQMQSKKSVPISAAKPTPQSPPKSNPLPKSNNNGNNNNGKKSNKRNNNNQKKKNKKNKKKNKTPKSQITTKPTPNNSKTASEPMVVRTVTADIEQKEQEQKNEVAEDKYVYRAHKIKHNLRYEIYNPETDKWENQEYRHTTMTYIGNIPSNIKVAAVQFFIMKKFKVSMRQIEETKLQKSGRGFNQFAFV